VLDHPVRQVRSEFRFSHRALPIIAVENIPSGSGSTKSAFKSKAISRFRVATVVVFRWIT
jgi:hypothetical protein